MGHATARERAASWCYDEINEHELDEHEATGADL